MMIDGKESRKAQPYEDDAGRFRHCRRESDEGGLNACARPVRSVTASFRADFDDAVSTDLRYIDVFIAVEC